MKKILSLMMAAILAFSTFTAALTAFADDLTGKTVVVYTSNLRGDVDKLPKIAAVKKDFETKGATVILADTGNFLQGSVYASADRGYTVFTLMEQAGYDVVALGKYDFAFGNAQMGAKPHGTLKQYLTLSQLFNGGDCDAIDEAKPASTIKCVATNSVGANDIFTFDGNMTKNTEIKGVTFFGVTDMSAPQFVLESSLSGVAFSSLTGVAAENPSVCLSNGDAVPCDLCIRPESADFEIGAYSIDSEKKTEKLAVDFENIAEDAAVRTAVDTAKAKIDANFPASALAKSEVVLNGSQTAVRAEETNLGDLWCDALRAFGLSKGVDVPDEDVVALWNGGNLRDYLYDGNICIQDVHKVLPYPNTAAVLYVKGADLLEALEAAQQYDAAFASVSGMEYKIKSYIDFAGGEQYENSTYKIPLSDRIEITSVNGQPFDKEKVYAVVTSNFIYNAGDTYCAFKNKVEGMNHVIYSSDKIVNVVWDYIKNDLGGVIGEAYAAPQGRITIDTEAPEEPVIPPAPVTPAPVKPVVTLPKKTVIKKLKKGKKSFTVYWKKIAGVRGYQVQYSTNRKFTKRTRKTVTVKGAKKVKRTVKKLKSKKVYYVRVRTYKKVNGKIKYSSWSKAKRIKVK